MVWIHDLNPVILDLPGPFQIGWYGVMYVLGFIFTLWYLRRRIKQGTAPLTLEQADSVLIWALIGLLIGARLFSVLVYNFAYYADNTLRMFALWEGGLSYHGGLVGIVLAVLLWCRKNKVGFLTLADILVVPLALANSFGRIGNFINGELPGRITSLPWGVQFPGVDGYRHPSQLYEAAYNVIIFLILRKLSMRQHAPGMILASYLIMYAVFRSATEFFRQPEILIGPLTMGQFLNLFMIAGGIGLIVWIRVKGR